MMSKLQKLKKLISELDTAVGMLLPDSMKSFYVKRAMEKVRDVSVALGELAEEEEDGEVDEA